MMEVSKYTGTSASYATALEQLKQELKLDFYNIWDRKGYLVIKKKQSKSYGRPIIVYPIYYYTYKPRITKNILKVAKL